MKQKLIGFSKQYVAALRSHLAEGVRESSAPALTLGRRAVALGLEMLEMARIHEQALVGLDFPKIKNAPVKRAEKFFSEAITSIVETHRVSRQGMADVNRLNRSLTRRTLELAVANRQLERGIVRQKRVEAALEKSGEHYAALLKESLQLQDGLRHLTHQVLAAQEEERRNVSRELQNEIAQTLLGINVRLLSLKQEALSNTNGLQKEIASTRRLVADSAKSARRVARDFGKA